eukprot:TRINITY_DN7873_c0_g1_i1.p1 TRINITY_DN7873_c0_g1~~TRINITY_DN7873_c0_g1_i1.p1  ORF type:complete len:592 (-),score=163.14 TRINITY_DN7873_c0_g1_i1:33-1703(-)
MGVGRRGFSKDEDIIAYYDKPEVLRQRAIELAELIKNSKYVVVYTGAGISVSSGLPDYRSEENGVWTQIDKGLEPKKTLDIESASPNFTHMALVALQKAGLIHYVVSTNIDGLHLRSGYPRKYLAELHGNAYQEYCEKCETKYIREYDCTKEGTSITHRTGRTCEVKDCGGNLLDCIVNFGEPLPEKEINAAESASRKGDLALVLGTSMRVEPACSLPSYIWKKEDGKMVICNLQKTPYDRRAEFRVQGFVDDVLALVTKHLGVKVDLETPSGYKAVDWVDNIDKIYPIKVKETEEKLKKKKEQQLANEKVKLVRPAEYVENLDGEKAKAIINEVRPNQLLYFKSCSGSSYAVDKVITKLIIENCHKSNFTLSTTIKTNFLELINCSELTFDIKVPIYTLSIDGCSTVTLNFDKPSLLGMVVSTKSKDLSINVSSYKIHHEITSPDTSKLITDKETTTSETSSTTTTTTTTEPSTQITTQRSPLSELDPDATFHHNPDLDQYITQWKDGSLITELVLRECEGMITTARQVAEDAATTEGIQSAMLNFARRAIKFSK